MRAYLNIGLVQAESSGFCYVNDIVLAILELLKYVVICFQLIGRLSSASHSSSSSSSSSSATAASTVVV